MPKSPVSNAWGARGALLVVLAHGLGRGRHLGHAVCAAYGWERVLRTDDPLRGGKLAAFVLHMTTKTTLAYGSIENYVWGVRASGCRARWSWTRSWAFSFGRSSCRPSRC